MRITKDSILLVLDITLSFMIVISILLAVDMIHVSNGYKFPIALLTLVILICDIVISVIFNTRCST